MSSKAQKKPLLVFISLPADGHTIPTLVIAEAMIQRGYNVAYVCSREYEPKITAVGAEFFESPGFYELIPPDHLARVNAMATGFNRMMEEVGLLFVASMPYRANALGAALEAIRQREGPHRQILVVHEIGAQAVMPFSYGRPPPKGFDTFPKTLGISTIPLMIRSDDVAPFLLGMPFDTSPACMARNRKLFELVEEGPMKPLDEAYDIATRESGATSVPPHPFFLWFEHSTMTATLCSPSMEYPVRDLSPTIKFVGCRPPTPSPDFVLPEWWADITSKDKKTVLVSQGTMNNENCHELIIPTLTALAGRDDVIVVATLGRRGAALPAGFEVPKNARVIDYIPYDTIFPELAVCVSNAGHGSFCHAATHGVPMVLAGETQDKREVSLRAAWAGIAINLGTHHPSVEQIREAVDKILGASKWKDRAMEMRRENEALDCFSSIEKLLVQLTD